MKILHEETIGGVRYMLNENGSVGTDGMAWLILHPDGSRVALPFKGEVFETAESFRARNWDRLRPLNENEQRTGENFIRHWEWRGDEFGSTLIGLDPNFSTLRQWAERVARGGTHTHWRLFRSASTYARKTCPPHLAVLDDGTIYRMAEDEMRNLNHDVVPCSTWDSVDLDSYAPGFAPGQRERVEAWMARQRKGEDCTFTDCYVDGPVEVEDPRDARICEPEEKLSASEKSFRDLADAVELAERPLAARIRELEGKLTEAKAEYSRRLNEYLDCEKEHYQQFVRKVEEERDAALARVKKLEAQLTKTEESSRELLEYYIGQAKRLLDEKDEVRSRINGLDVKPPGWGIDGTTYFRADHPRVLRGDEFRSDRGDVWKALRATVDESHSPAVETSKWNLFPWAAGLSTATRDFLRAYWLANYQLAPGEYLDEEAGVVRRREPEPEPEAKQLEPFFTDERGDTWQFVRFRQGWCAIKADVFEVISYRDDGPVSDALRAYVASVGEGES